MYDHEHDPRDAEEDEQRSREPLAKVRDHVRVSNMLLAAIRVPAIIAASVMEPRKQRAQD